MRHLFFHQSPQVNELMACKRHLFFHQSPQVNELMVLHGDTCSSAWDTCSITPHRLMNFCMRHLFFYHSPQVNELMALHETPVLLSLPTPVKWTHGTAWDTCSSITPHRLMNSWYCMRHLFFYHSPQVNELMVLHETPVLLSLPTF